MATRPLRSMAMFALLVATLGLGACANTVIAMTPVFTAEDGAGAPRLKPGFWAFDACGDPRAQGAAFCADGYLISNDTLDITDFANQRSGATQAGGTFKDPPFPYRLGVGEPLLMQIQLTAIQADGPERAFYVFLALDPKSRDDEGRITRAEVWFVKCGPQGEARRIDSYGPPPTDHPFAGVTVTDYGCAPTDRAGLFSAARASHALPRGEVQRGVYRWISARRPDPVGKPAV